MNNHYSSVKKEVSSGQPVGSSLCKNGQNSFLVAYLIRISWWLRWKCTCNWCKQKRNFHKVHFSRFFLSKTHFWTFRLIFNFLLMENLTDIYIWPIYQWRNRMAVGFLHDLEEDFGNEKIRLGDISSIYGFFSTCISWWCTTFGLKLEIRQEYIVCTAK